MTINTAEMDDNALDARVMRVLSQAYPEIRDVDEKARSLPHTVKMRILDLLCSGVNPHDDEKRQMDGILLEDIRALYANHLRNPNG